MLFSDLDQTKTYSFADYYEWTFGDRVELINGKVYKMMAAPSSVHQEISGNIYNSIRTFLEDKNCKVFYAPFDVRIPTKGIDDQSIFTVLQPDICVICDISKIDLKGCLGAPDIVVEILSPGNNSKELRKKYEVYEDAGVKEYWIVSPQYQMLTICTLVDRKFQKTHILTPGDVITSPLLQGFSLNIANIFRNINYDGF